MLLVLLHPSAALACCARQLATHRAACCICSAGFVLMQASDDTAPNAKDHGSGSNRSTVTCGAAASHPPSGASTMNGAASTEEVDSFGCTVQEAAELDAFRRVLLDGRVSPEEVRSLFISTMIEGRRRCCRAGCCSHRLVGVSARCYRRTTDNSRASGRAAAKCDAVIFCGCRN